MNEHQNFFDNLLNETEKAYLASEIKKENLYYSVCSTPIFINSTLLLGFNWGKSNDEADKPQKKIPIIPFKQIPDLGSFKWTIDFFNKYLPRENLQEFVQSNFCFFRSQKENDISLSDLKLSHPLFESFITYVQPKRIICFSARLKQYFEDNGKLFDCDPKIISSGLKTIYTTKAKIDINDRKISIFFLPHPNYPILGSARHEAWKHCFVNSVTSISNEQ